MQLPWICNSPVHKKTRQHLIPHGPQRDAAGAVIVRQSRPVESVACQCEARSALDPGVPADAANKPPRGMPRHPLNVLTVHSTRSPPPPPPPLRVHQCPLLAQQCVSISRHEAQKTHPPLANIACGQAIGGWLHSGCAWAVTAAQLGEGGGGGVMHHIDHQALMPSRFCSSITAGPIPPPCNPRPKGRPSLHVAQGIALDSRCVKSITRMWSAMFSPQRRCVECCVAFSDPPDHQYIAHCPASRLPLAAHGCHNCIPPSPDLGHPTVHKQHKASP